MVVRSSHRTPPMRTHQRDSHLASYGREAFPLLAREHPVDADVVVYCTGYQIAFPFFDEDFISAPDNHIELFRRVFHPDIPNVFFIGLLQPLISLSDHVAELPRRASYPRRDRQLHQPDLAVDRCRLAVGTGWRHRH